METTAATLTLILTASTRVQVVSIKAAQIAVREHIERPNGDWIGSASFGRCAKAGNVYENGRLVARISYNGRAWSPNGSEIQ